jgi:phospholipid/cholesterol/gamma-HCH transport system ATP-binding protein
MCFVIDGEEITCLDERALGPRRRKIGMLFQNGALFDSMDVRENVVFPLRETGVGDEDELEARALEVLGLVGLAEHLGKMPIALSGGMRKRVALARALITRPAAVFYDEPTAGLDPVVSDQITHLIRRTQQKFGITQVVVTHDIRSVYHVADHVAFMKDGRIYFTGTPQDLRHCRDPEVRDFILGRSHESIAAGLPEPGPCDPLPGG